MLQYQRALTFDPENEEALAALKELQKVERTVRNYQARGIAVPRSTGRTHDVNFLSAYDLVNRARLAFQKGNIDLALNHVDEALAREPNYGEAQRLKAQIQEYVAAAETIRSVNVFLDREKAREAVDLLDRLIAKFPARHDLLVMRARGYNLLGSFKRALQDLDRALQLGVAIKKLLRHYLRAYAGLGDSGRAYAVAAAIEDMSWLERMRWYARAFPLALGALAGGILLFCVALYYLWRNLDDLLGFRRLKTLGNLVRLLLACKAFGPGSQVGELQLLAKELDIPWLHYLAGLALLDQGFVKQAQTHFQAAAPSPGLACGAYFFLGVTRRKLRQTLAEHDFDSAMMVGFQGFRPTWRPRFFRDMERRVLLECRPDDTGNEEELYAMAFDVVQGYVM